VVAVSLHLAYGYFNPPQEIQVEYNKLRTLN
jgi:hypothetical protein